MPIHYTQDNVWREVSGEDGRPLATVRGLSLLDFQALLDTYAESADEIIKLYNQVTAAHGSLQSLSESDLGSALTYLLSNAPGMICTVLALGTEEEEDLVRGLPMGIQVLLLQGIVTATFHEAGGVKKLMGTLGSLQRAMRSPKAKGQPKSP